jgi:hypothetical protein
MTAAVGKTLMVTKRVRKAAKSGYKIFMSFFARPHWKNRLSLDGFS